jgi:hypothetical protein
MTFAASIVLYGFILSGVAWVSYGFGRDTAERNAYATISTLRSELRAVKLDMARMAEKYRITGR